MKLTDFRQTAFVSTENLNKAVFCFEDIEDGAKIEILGVKISVDSELVEALIPCVNSETLASVTLHLKDGSFISYTYTVKPVKKSEICIINISPCANKYDNYCILESEDKNFSDKAVRVCGELPDFKYALVKPSKEADEFLKNGQIEAIPDISGFSTQSAFGEDMAQKLSNPYFCETAYMKNSSGLSLGAVPYLCDAGIKYVIISPDLTGTNQAAFAADLFKLSCKSSDVIVYIHNDKSIIPEFERSSLSFSAQSELVEYKLSLKNSVLSDFEQRADELLSKRSVVPVIYESEPTVFLKALSDEMASKWKNPIISMATPTEFMKKLAESVQNMPSVSLEISCPGADDLTAYGNLTAKRQKYAYELQSANALSLIKATENPQNGYPESEFLNTMSEIADFPVQNIDFNSKSPIEMHRFNMFYSKERPLINAEKLIENAYSRFIDREAEGFVTAINSTLNERKFGLLSPVALDGITCQKTDEGYITEPVMLPAFGAKSFVCGEYKECAPFARQSGNVIDTGYYRVTFDEKYGTISSILETSAMRELIDSSSLYHLGDMIYTAGISDSLDLNVQKNIDFTIESGPLAISLTRRGIEEQSKAEVTSKIIFYKHTKNIDISLKFKNATTLCGDFYDRYKKNIFFAFPLRCENGRFVTTHILGELDDAKDRLSLGTSDFSVCSRYAALENDYCGTMIACREMPVFHFGKLQSASVLPQGSASASNIFLYAASNRANQLIYQNDDLCRGEFNLTIYPFRGKAEYEVYEKADIFLHPAKIVPGYSVERSRMSVSEEGISFGSLKFNNGVFFLRVAEVLGIPRRLTISVPFKLQKAFYSDISGNEKNEIKEFSENRVTVEIKASSPLTLKLYPARSYNIKKVFPQGISYYSYISHCGRITAVWDKHDNIPQESYEIICDGEKIAEVKAQNSKTQIYMTDVIGNHKIEVK